MKTFSLIGTNYHNSLIINITLPMRWYHKNLSSMSLVESSTTVFLGNLWSSRRNIVMIYLSQGISMRISMTSSGCKNRTLKFTSTWCRRWMMIQIIILLFLKHGSK